MQRLQAAGVPAGVVQRESDLLADPQLAHRGHWIRTQHAHLGTLLVERAGFRLADAPGGYTHCGPLLGEHTDAILRDVLGLDAAEIARLLRAGGVSSNACRAALFVLEGRRMHPSSFLRTFWRTQFRPEVFVAMSVRDVVKQRLTDVIEPAI